MMTNNFAGAIDNTSIIPYKELLWQSGASDESVGSHESLGTCTIIIPGAGLRLRMAGLDIDGLIEIQNAFLPL
jgi:hypothetical protein